MTAQEVKFDIIRQLLDLEDMGLLIKINQLLNPVKASKKEKEDSALSDFDASKLSFEEWSKQFTDKADSKEWLPEYGMTMGEFRMKIYESERSPTITYEELGQAITSWKNE